MKLSFCLLLAVVAAASADQGFYKPQSVAQSAPSGPQHENNFDYRPVAKQSWLDKLFGSNRRQGIAGILGGLAGPGFIAAKVAFAVFVAMIATVAYVVGEASSSGRGLHTNEWEVDHSFWMDKLREDFESSWSQK